MLEQKMKQPEVLPFEMRFRKADGSPVSVEVRAKVIKYENTTARLVTVLNLADRKMAQQEQVHVMTMAENVRVRDEFISIASHELKTPLTALKLQMLMIERDVKKQSAGTYTPAFLKDLLAMFNSQVDRLTEIVDTLLDVSKISAGRLELNLQDVDLADLLNDTVASLHMQGRVIVHSPRHLPLLADKERVIQIIENLLNNAIKYGEGKPVTALLEPREDYAVLTVEDRGSGIAPQDLKRIFDRFERAIPAKNISGFGLGLYVTREIVQAHGGFITAESKPGAGTTFIVRLPLKKTR
jgi:signal transduction histidine kinase